MKNSLQGHIPDAAFAYCQQFFRAYSFRFLVKKERSTKLGDFRKDRENNFTITVNNNLNPYQFLITFIHELAHLKVSVENSRKVAPHGTEWKSTFRELMLPLLNSKVFPDAILRPLARHMRNPRAAAATDARLWNALKYYDNNAAVLTLEDIAKGSSFIFNKRKFIKQDKKRTRVVCCEERTGRLYLIPAIAEVEAV